MHVEDCFQNLNFRLVFHHKPLQVDEGGEPVGELFFLTGEAPKEQKEEETSNVEDKATKQAESKMEDEDDELIEVVSSSDAPRKRAKIEAHKKVEEDDDDLIVIE